MSTEGTGYWDAGRLQDPKPDSKKETIFMLIYSLDCG